MNDNPGKSDDDGIMALLESGNSTGGNRKKSRKKVTFSNIHQYDHDKNANKEVISKSSERDISVADEPQSFSTALNKKPAFDMSSIDDILSGGNTSIGEENNTKQGTRIQKLTRDDSEEQPQKEVS